MRILLGLALFFGLGFIGVELQNRKLEQNKVLFDACVAKGIKPIKCSFMVAFKGEI